jgi:O-antigen/teichoic acid export membrane protein
MAAHGDLHNTLTEHRSIWRRARRNLSISATGSAFLFAVKFAQTALLTKLLKVEDFGRLLIVINFFVFLDSFFGVRVSDAVFRFFPAFKAQGDERSLKGLLLICLGICAGSGLLIYLLVLVLSPWLTNRFYPQLGLTPLLRIYGLTILLTSFSGVYEPILRLHDRFIAGIAPQVIGSVVTLGLLIAYFAREAVYDLEIVVAVFAIGGFIQTVPPLISALRIVRRFLQAPGFIESLHALRLHRDLLTGTFLNSNFSGYLKLAISPGDVFLLGLFSSPTQLAYYGLAKQLTAPLAFLQTNLEMAINPEIATLTGRRQFAQLKCLLGRYFMRTLAIGSLLLIGVILVGHVLISFFLSPAYAAALPIFYLLAIAAWLLLVLLVFRPLALNLDLLRWHNLGLLISALIVILIIAAGRLSAYTMAAIQLIDALVLRSLFSTLVWNRLRRLGNDQ